MKTRKLSLFRSLIVGAVLALAACSFEPPAHAADFVYKDVNVSSSLTTVSNTTATATDGTVFDIPQNVSIVIQPDFYGANGGTSNVWYQFNLSTDTTNYSTYYPISVTNAATGTGTNCGWHVITAAQLSGARKGRLDAVGTTQTNNITTRRVRIGYFY